MDEKKTQLDMNIFIRGFIFRAIDMPQTRFFYTQCLGFLETYTCNVKPTLQIAVFMPPQRGLRPTENHPLSVSLRFEANGRDAVEGNHVSVSPYQAGDNSLLVCFVSDIKLTMSRIREAGGTIVTEIIDEFNARTAVVLDPNGYRVRLQQLPTSLLCSTPAQRAMIPDTDCRIAVLQAPCLSGDVAARWYDQVFSVIVPPEKKMPFKDKGAMPDHSAVRPYNGRRGLHTVDRESFLQLRCSYHFIAAGDRTMYPAMCLCDSVRQQTELKTTCLRGVSIHVPNLDEFWPSLSQQDVVAIVADPHDKPGVGRVGYIRDPAGLLLELSADARTVRSGTDPRVPVRAHPGKGGDTAHSVLGTTSISWTTMIGTRQAREHRRREDADLGDGGTADKDVTMGTALMNVRFGDSET